MTKHPNPRAAIENLWDRATPVVPLLDAYRDQVLTEAAELIASLPQDYELDPGRGDARQHLLAARTTQES